MAGTRGNRSSYRYYLPAAGMVVLLLGSVPASAEQISITGEPCPVPVEGAETESILLTEFTVLGAAGDTVLIRYEAPEAQAEEESVEEVTELTELTDPGTHQMVYGSVSAAELLSLLPQLDLSALPSAASTDTVSYGGDTATVAAIQHNLVDTGYLQAEVLEGGAEGQYGPATTGAVSAFQEAHGLAVTGEADIYTVLTLQGVADGTFDKELQLEYPANLPPDEKFAAIMDKTDKDLTVFADPTWRFQYDVYEKSGTIDPGLPVASMSVEAPDMDRIRMEASLRIVLTTSKGVLKLRPAIVFESAGAYRPYVQSVTFTKDGNAYENKKGVSSGGLDGALVQESAYVPLTAETLDLLSASPELDMRVTGKNNKYDMHFSADAEKLAAFAAAAKTLLQ